jgi:hypothetical protein
MFDVEEVPIEGLIDEESLYAFERNGCCSTLTGKAGISLWQI